MGIVVMLGMLAGLVLMLANIRQVSLKSLVVKLLAVFVLLCGLWNAFWYGTQHLQQFWGMVAFGSGLVMIVTAMVVLSKRQSMPLNLVLITLLSASFLLYLVTIVQLNLGLPIIR